MNKEIKCSDCVKFKTQYCPCTIDCMATDDYPFYQNRKTMLEENANLKQALIDIREKIYVLDLDEEAFDILQIIDYMLGDEK